MVAAEHISQYYGARQALADVSFHIEKPGVVGFLGRNGAGKSTALRVLSALLMPTAGRVRLFGVDTRDDPHEARKRVGFLPDRPPLYTDMSPRELLRYAARLRDVPGGALRAHVDEALALTDLVAVADERIEWLSHGYRQRVGIAQAIVHRPSLVILDEPISGLDPEQIVSMRALIRRLADERIVLFSSHILGEIALTCDRILMLHEGRVVAQGDASDWQAPRAAHDMQLRVRAPADALVEVASSVAGITQVEVRLAAPGGPAAPVAQSASDSEVMLSLRASSADAVEALVATLVQRGFGVRELVKRERPDLESLFLRLTGGEGGSVPSSLPVGVPSAGALA